MISTKIELYELIGRQAEKLIQLEITKSKAKDGFLLDSAIENSLRDSGLASVVEELNSKNSVVAEKIQTFIEKEEKVLLGLINQLKKEGTTKTVVTVKSKRELKNGK